MAPYGIFTERQRKYLTGELTDPKDERAIRGKIRDRLDTAFAEFTLLATLGSKDRRLVFEDRVVAQDVEYQVVDGAWKEIEPGQLKRGKDRFEAGGGAAMFVGLEKLLQFAYEGLRRNNWTPEEIYKHAIEGGIKAGEAGVRNLEPRDILLEWREEEGYLNPEEVDVHDMSPMEKWENDMPLTSADVKALKAEGVIEGPTD